MSRLRNILLLLVLLVCAASFWWVRRDGAGTLPSPPQRPTASRPAPAELAPVPLRNVHVAVLNGTGEAGLARRFSRRLPEIGCVVVSVADAPNDQFRSTLLINRRLDASEVRQLAARLGDPRILQEWDGRSREDVVLVLGADHGSLELKPSRELD